MSRRLELQLYRRHRTQFDVVRLADPANLSADVHRSQTAEPASARLDAQEPAQFGATGSRAEGPREHVRWAECAAGLEVDVCLLRVVGVGRLLRGGRQRSRQHRRQSVFVGGQEQLGVAPTDVRRRGVTGPQVLVGRQQLHHHRSQHSYRLSVLVHSLLYSRGYEETLRLSLSLSLSPGLAGVY